MPPTFAVREPQRVAALVTMTWPPVVEVVLSYAGNATRPKGVLVT